MNTMNKHPRSDHQKGIKFDSEFVERSSSHYQPGIKFQHPRHEVRYWPDYDRNKNVGLPTTFLVITFSVLIAWILIAYLLS